MSILEFYANERSWVSVISLYFVREMKISASIHTNTAHKSKTEFVEFYKGSGIGICYSEFSTA